MIWIPVAAVVGFCVGFCVGYWIGHHPQTPKPTETEPAKDADK